MQLSLIYIYIWKKFVYDMIDKLFVV